MAISEATYYNYVWKKKYANLGQHGDSGAPPAVVNMPVPTLRIFVSDLAALLQRASVLQCLCGPQPRETCPAVSPAGTALLLWEDRSRVLFFSGSPYSPRS